MHDVLTDIVRRKRVEVAAAKELVPLERLVEEAGGFTHRSTFLVSLRAAKRPAIIAEIKVASPTHPELGSLADAVARAGEYERAGADAISFITEKHYFKTDLADLVKVKRAVSRPVLQKDFVIDEYQVYLAHQAGVDALLLIARLVDGAALNRLVDLALELGVEPVVEVNDEADLAKAVATGTNIVAVNARDLRTFQVDVAAACELLGLTPDGFLRLGFSGVASAKEVRQYVAAGADGVLVGTSLMQAPDIGAFIQGLRD